MKEAAEKSSSVPYGFTLSPPRLQGNVLKNQSHFGIYWAMEYEDSVPIPVSVRFVGGVPEGVTLPGRQGTYFPTVVRYWGPPVAYEGRESATLAQARERMLQGKDLLNNFCPCCHQLVKLYRRKLHTEMALFLIKLVKAYQKSPRWYSTRELLPATAKSATDGAYLTRWGLVEKLPSMNSSGGKAGMYRPTSKGIEFALGQDFVPSHVHILCGKVVGFSETVTNIQQCLGRKFNYSELMLG